MHALLAFSCLSLFAAAHPDDPPKPAEDLFAAADRNSVDKAPDGLKRAFARFVRVATDPKVTPAQLEALCLPMSVRVDTDPRDKDPEFGQGMNVPFLTTGTKGFRFSPRPQGVKKLADGCYYVSTQTTHVLFVLTQAGEWKIYRYFDMPGA